MENNSLFNFVGIMRDYHDLQREFDDLNFLFALDDKQFDKFYNEMENEKLIDSFR